MSNTRDVNLRIRAKNLTKATLGEITSDVEELTAAQKALSTTLGLAARSMADLTAEQARAQAAERELGRRSDLIDKYRKQAQQVRELADRLAELASASQRSPKGDFIDKGVTAQVTKLSKALAEQEGRLHNAGNALAEAGIDVRALDDAQAQINGTLTRARGAYDTATGAVERYSDAVRRAKEIQAEVQRRRDVERNAMQPVVDAVRDRNRRVELDALRRDIELRAQQAKSLEIAAEAQRRLNAEQEAASRIPQAVIDAVGRKNRQVELDAMRREIELRAEQARALEITAEAQRRLNAEQEAASRIPQAVIDAVGAKNRRVELDAMRRNSELLAEQYAARDREAASLAASNARREALVRLLGTERGQRVLAAEAARQGAQADAQAASAKGRLAAETTKAERAMRLFGDTGRKSLSVYQRVRGQVLGLASAYIGIYEAINTVTKAIDATNRGQSLQIGLRTVNDGNVAAAAEDYKFLRTEADRLGVVFDDLAPQYANLASSAKALGLSNSQVRQTFSDIATAAAAMNLSVEDTEGVFRAMTQIFSKGKVSAEELRGQLGDRLPGAVVKFAKASSIALTDLDKQLQEGLVGVDFVIRGIEAYANGYDAEMANVTERLQAYINRAKNAYNDWLRVLLDGDSQTKLKQAFQVVTDFFKGQQGKEFAEGLGTAFAALVDIFIVFAKNMDAVVAVAKVFFAVMALKAITDIGLSFVSTAKKVSAFRMEVLAAAKGTGKMAVAARGLSLAFGPVGIALAAATALLLDFTSQISRAEQETDDMIGALDRLASARSTSDIAAETGSASKALAQARTRVKELEELKKLRNNSAAGNIQQALTNPLRELELARKYVVLNEEGLDTQLSLANAIVKQGEKALAQAGVRRDFAEEEEAAQARKDAEALKNLATPGGTKKEKGPSEKQIRNEENARLDAQRAIQKKLLDLDQELFDARSTGEVRTAEQVQQGYALQVDTIKSEIEEAYLGLQKLAQTQFALAGVSTPQPSEAAGADARLYYEELVLAAQQLGLAEANNLRIAGERVEALRLARNDKAFEKSETQDIEVIERNINDLVEQRASRVAHINALKEAGTISEVDAYNAINATQDGYNQRIESLVHTILPLLQAIGADDPRFAWAQKMTADMELLLVKQRQYTTAQRIAMNLGEQAAGGAADAFGTLAEGIAGALRETNSLGDAFGAAADAFRSFAADFLVQIGQMIAQAVILRAIENAFGAGGGGGYWNAAISVLTGHTGGVVSGRIGTNRSMQVHPAVFAGAPRFHGGGLPGLASDEVPAILKKREEVLAQDDPRNVLNGGMMPAAAAPAQVTVVNTLDGADVIRQGLPNGGMNAIINEMGKNKNAIRKQLGIA